MCPVMFFVIQDIVRLELINYALMMKGVKFTQFVYSSQLVPHILVSNTTD